jgi:hypothetical protein
LEEENLLDFFKAEFSSCALIEDYLPSILPIIHEGGFPWKKIDKLFNERILKLSFEDKNPDDEFQISIFEVLQIFKITVNREVQKRNVKRLSIEEILPHCNEAEQRIIGMHQFLLDLFSELEIRLDKKGKQLFRDTLYSVFTNFDSKYINFIGEAAVLNSFLKNNFKLIGVEVKVPNAKPIDFKFQMPKSYKLYNLEVLNIHFDTDRLGTDERIEKFLIGRIIQKLKKKILNHKIHALFYLAPVLWGNIEGLRKIQKIFNNKPNLLGNYVLEPSVYITKRSDTEVFNFFGRITTIDLYK